MADPQLVNMSGQFSGLPMSQLIGGPLQAACDAQNMLSAATANFIKDVGLQSNANGELTARTVDFSFDRASAPDPTTGQTKVEKVDLKVPLLAIVNTPNLSIKEAEVNFTMSVSSSDSSESSQDTSGTMSAEAKLNYGIFSMKVKMTGSVASHSSNTRKSDNSAKYDVRVLARDDGPPEGLMKMLDMLQSAITPIPASSAPAS